MEITVKADIKNAIKGLSRLQRKVIPAAIVTAMNEAATKGISTARKSIAADLNVKQKYINRLLSK